MSIWGSCNIQIYIGDTPHLKGQVLSLPSTTPGTEHLRGLGVCLSTRQTG